MSPISLTSFAVGILAVGLLYALHYLRIQPEQQRVATLMFWKQAIRQQRTKVLFTKRFSHPATFALVALILLALAAALTADRWGRTGDERRADVLVIDTGSAMSAASGGKTVLASAADLALTDLRQLPGTPALVTAGASPLLLARGDEPAAVVRDRLAALTAEANASGSSLALALAGTLQGSRSGDIYWYTTQSELPAGLPANVAGRVKLRRVAPPTEAVAITGATFEASTEDPSTGTLKVRLAGKASGALTLAGKLADTEIPAQPVAFTGSSAEVAFPALPANGQTLQLTLAGAPGSAAEHTVAFILPRRTPMKVNFVGNIPETLRHALRAAGAEEGTGQGSITVVEEGTQATTAAAIIISKSGTAIPSGQPLLPTTSPLTADLNLEDATLTNGTAVTPTGTILLTSGGEPVATLADMNGQRTLLISSALLTETADLPKRAAFPVLLGRVAADLAGWSEAPPVVTALRAVEDPLWQSDAPTSLTTVHTAPPDAAISTAVVDAAPTATAGFASNLRWVEVLLAAALTFLVVEGFLLAARKIV